MNASHSSFSAHARMRSRRSALVAAVIFIALPMSGRAQGQPAQIATQLVAATATPFSAPNTFPVLRLTKLSKQPQPAPFSIHAVTVAGHQDVVASPTKPATFRVRTTDSVTITGWAFDPSSNLPAGGVAIELNGRRMPASYGLARADVGKTFHTPALTNVGFSARLSGRDLTIGTNALSIIVVSNDRTSYYVNSTQIRLDKS